MQYQAHIPFNLTRIFIEKLGYEPENQNILIIRDLFTGMYLSNKNKVIFVTDDYEAYNKFKNFIVFNSEFGSNDEAIYIDVKNNKNAWLEFINDVKNLPIKYFNIESDNTWTEFMKDVKNLPKFSYCIANPPYQFGNKIFNVLKDVCDTSVVIMPLNQYKTNDLYKHVESFELADPKVFETAVITENLNISVIKNNETNKFTWQELVLESCDPHFRKFYDWNIDHNRNIVMKQMSYKTPADFNVHLDFWETCKCFSSLGGGGFGSNGGGYKWNVLYDNSAVNAGIGHIHFNTKNAKDNFCKWWYNGKKGISMASRVALGIHMGGSVGPNTFIALPQIDWETIDQHPLWNTDVDTAVLDTMGLKWDINKENIILK